MASATKTYTNDQLFAVLTLGKTQKPNFTAAQIPVASATTMAQAYLDLQIAKDTSFPFGRSLQQFADAQIKLIKAAIAAA